MSVLLNLKPESSDTREETVQREVMESRSGRPRTEACTFLCEHVTGLIVPLLYRASGVFSGPSPLLRP